MRTNKGIESILKRRSCRSYSNRKVKDTILEQIVECGSMAPSAMNKQSTSILVITNAKMINKIRKLSIAVRGRDCFYGAKTFVLVYGNNQDKFIVHDGSCMMENLMVAATALKVSSCWINQMDELLSTKQGEKIKEELGLEKDDAVIGTCILGYSQDKNEITPKPRKEKHVKYLK